MPHRRGPGIELLADPDEAADHRPPGDPRPATLDDRRRARPPPTATTRQLHLMRDAGLIAAMPSLVDRRAVLYVIAPRQHGPITAWLAGTAVGRPIALAIDDGGRLHHG